MTALPTPPYVRTTGRVRGALSDRAQSDYEFAGPSLAFAVSESFNASLGLPDLVLVSLDAVLFYVDSELLLSASGNAFNDLPAMIAAQLDDSHAPATERGGHPLPTVFMVEEESILTLVLHAVYGRALSACTPSAADLEAAGDALINRYAVRVPPFGCPGCVLYDAAVALARRHPLDAYMLAACFGAGQLAVTCSARLLSFPLASLTEAHALRMGVHFFCRFMCLHIRRVAALGNLLTAPPRQHTPSPVCSQARTDDLRNCWTIAGAAIMCDATAGTTNSHLEAVLCPLLSRLGCRTCHHALSTRISELCSQWSSVKDTI